RLPFVFQRRLCQGLEKEIARRTAVEPARSEVEHARCRKSPASVSAAIRPGSGSTATPGRAGQSARQAAPVLTRPTRLCWFRNNTGTAEARCGCVDEAIWPLSR